MFENGMTKERLATFSDGVFAVVITIMVLQLKLPSEPAFGAVLAQWPTALSYVVSYVLVTIMWINHHFLLTLAKHVTPRLILLNCAHIFAASLVPFATAWVAATRIASVPVFVYAAVIVMVNLSYHAFAYDVVPRSPENDGSTKSRRIAMARSITTLALFTAAMFLSLKLPLVAFLLIICILLTYARPELPRGLRRQGVERGVGGSDSRH